MIENPHKKVDIEFEMKGDVFKNGLPLPITIKSLTAVQNIFDKSYLELSFKNKLSFVDRKEFYLQSQGINRGSLIATLGLVYSAVQPGLPVITNLGPNGVWEYAKETFSFLKLVYEQIKKGEKAVITVDENSGLALVNTGTQTITFNAPVINIASNSLPSYEILNKMLLPKYVEEIRLGENGQSPIYLNLDDAHLFDLPSVIDKSPQSIHGEFYEFDKFNKRGRIFVSPSQDIDVGSYKFQVVGNQNLLDYIEALKGKHVVITCLKETVDHPLGGVKVVSLQVLDVAS